MQCLSDGLSFYQFIAFSFIGELCSLFNAVCFILLLSLAFIYLCFLCYFFNTFLVVALYLFALLFLYLFSLFCLFIIPVACSCLFIYTLCVWFLHGVDTQFRDSWMSMRQRTPMMRKIMNRSRIFEIRISLRA